MTFQLNPKDQTFVELQNGNYPWWDNLKANKDISIQIRKDNTIDAYYNGGAILTGLKFDVQEKCFTASIHPKYIPLKDEKTYQALTLDAQGVKFATQIDPLALAQLGDTELKAVINRVKKYNDAESEKAIQYKFAVNDPYIIDTEFQLENDLRIDLIRLDASVQKIVLIEVKTMGDRRLFIDTAAGIHDQLEKYKNFAGKHSEELITYYAKVLQVKNDLGITKPELKKITLAGWDIEAKPLLAFGDCEQRWIDQNADGAEGIDARIKDVAYGVYYFGDAKYSLDLLPKTQRNRHIF